MVLIGGSKVTQLSYLEYQVLMLALAGVICTAIGTVEIALSRFQVLPLLFPGVFTVRERRFFFFNFDVSDGVLGKQIRAEAKMLIRLTICVVLSYLWQHCVLETTQKVGIDFPVDECEDGHDCFASKLHFDTFFTRSHEAIDCGGNHEDFPSRVVVSCIKFIQPSATKWLMHLAIAHSVTQLNFKAYEVLVWIAGNSTWIRYLLGTLIFVSLSTFIGLFLGGVLSEFVSSWLSFVMSFAIPVFLHTVWKTAKALECLWKQDSEKVQQSIEGHLNMAFKDIEDAVVREALSSDDQDSFTKTSSGRGIHSLAAKKAARLPRRSLLKNLLAGIKEAPKKVFKRTIGEEQDTPKGFDAEKDGSARKCADGKWLGSDGAISPSTSGITHTASNDKESHRSSPPPPPSGVSGKTASGSTRPLPPPIMVPTNTG